MTEFWSIYKKVTFWDIYQKWLVQHSTFFIPETLRASWWIIRFIYIGNIGKSVKKVTFWDISQKWLVKHSTFFYPRNTPCVMVSNYIDHMIGFWWNFSFTRKWNFETFLTNGCSTFYFFLKERFHMLRQVIKSSWMTGL